MSLQYIIDGCNVTHNFKFIKILPKKYSDSRAYLIELIKSRNLCGSSNNLIWVVFDGYPQEGLENLEKIRLKIIFSRRQSADEKIKKILELTDNPRNTVVVSDDKEVSSFARIMRAKAISVEEFIKVKVPPKDKSRNLDEAKVNYTQMQRINKELKEIWLKEK
ncbi:MAG: NYN domain-containing protein [Candidatus Omnitrophota bacterium]